MTDMNVHGNLMNFKPSKTIQQIPYQEKEDKIVAWKDEINIDPLKSEAYKLAKSADLNRNGQIDETDIRIATTEDLESYNDFLNDNYKKLTVLFGNSEVEKINSFVKKELKDRLIDNSSFKLLNMLQIDRSISN